MTILIEFTINAAAGGDDSVAIFVARVGERVRMFHSSTGAAAVCRLCAEWAAMMEYTPRLVQDRLLRMCDDLSAAFRWPAVVRALGLPPWRVCLVAPPALRALPLHLLPAHGAVVSWHDDPETWAMRRVELLVADAVVTSLMFHRDATLALAPITAGSVLAMHVPQTDQQANEAFPLDTALPHLSEDALDYVTSQFAGERVVGSTRDIFVVAHEGAQCIYLSCHQRRHTLVLRSTRFSSNGVSIIAGAVTPYDIGVLSRAPLVVLTGYARDDAFARAFMVAGARAVIHSLWPVPESAIRVLMARLFAALNASPSMHVSEALAQAQLDTCAAFRSHPPLDMMWTPASTAVAAATTTGDDAEVPRVDPDYTHLWGNFVVIGE